jgi:hypothetical protein
MTTPRKARATLVTLENTPKQPYTDLVVQAITEELDEYNRNPDPAQLNVTRIIEHVAPDGQPVQSPRQLAATERMASTLGPPDRSVRIVVEHEWACVRAHRRHSADGVSVQCTCTTPTVRRVKAGAP